MIKIRSNCNIAKTDVGAARTRLPNSPGPGPNEQQVEGCSDRPQLVEKEERSPDKACTRPSFKKSSANCPIGVFEVRRPLLPSETYKAKPCQKF